MATNYSSPEPFVQAFRSGIGELILGADAGAPERLYEKLISLTSQRIAHEKGWGRETLIRILSAVDIACWDAIGKFSNMPLYRIFGGYRNEVPCYITCAYYRDGKDLGELRDEIVVLKEKGFKAFKAKIGGLPLKDDLKRMEVVRDVIGPQSDLMVDVNRSWSLAEAIDGARELHHLNIRWLEEPVRWLDDHRELQILSRHTSIPAFRRESELAVSRCRDLVESRAIQILQADSTMSGGYTALRKLSALCELNHVHLAPHHDCFLHAPIVAASPAGLILQIVRSRSRSASGRTVRKPAKDCRRDAHDQRIPRDRRQRRSRSASPNMEPESRDHAVTARIETGRKRIRRHVAQIAPRRMPIRL